MTDESFRERSGGQSFAEFEKMLDKLDDCDLGEWDRDFVDDMIKRAGKWGEQIAVSGKQWEQLERMRNQYGI